MLGTLSIRDVVLIEKLDLTFGRGLSVLTGETGAGKSILLDSLGLALGERAEAGLVRQGAEQASVTAVFDYTGNTLDDIFEAQGLSPDVEADGLIVKRVVNKDGRSRAYINGEPATVGTLKAIGERLAEIHGQFESQRLLNPAAHRGLLDAYGNLSKDGAKVRSNWKVWREKEAEVKRAQESYDQAQREEEFLRHAVDELGKMAPAPGEDAELSASRTGMMHGEKIAEAIKAADKELDAGKGVQWALQNAAKHLNRVADKVEGKFESVIATLDRASAEVDELHSGLSRLQADLDLNPASLEQVEERLFALRALARKHDVQVDDLAALLVSFNNQIAAIEDGGSDIIRLKAEATKARETYQQTAQSLSDKRQKAGVAMAKAISLELEPLKLGSAIFVVGVDVLDEAEWGETGMNRVSFLIATNPGSVPAPIGKVASGGELSRFTLALKVVLAQTDNVPTIVFDEVDSGIGGATAAAVGERLVALAKDVQVLVVTHSPQVASMGEQHWQVSKQVRTQGADKSVRTSVNVLEPNQREEEIARMLAGAEITDEARAAAVRLLENRNQGTAA